MGKLWPRWSVSRLRRVAITPHAGLTHLLPDLGRDLNVPSPQHRIPPCSGPAALAPLTSKGRMREKGLSCSGGGFFSPSQLPVTLNLF